MFGVHFVTEHSLNYCSLPFYNEHIKTVRIMLDCELTPAHRLAALIIERGRLCLIFMHTETNLQDTCVSYCGITEKRTRDLLCYIYYVCIDIFDPMGCFVCPRDCTKTRPPYQNIQCTCARKRSENKTLMLPRVCDPWQHHGSANFVFGQHTVTGDVVSIFRRKQFYKTVPRGSNELAHLHLVRLSLALHHFPQKLDLSRITRLTAQ